MQPLSASLLALALVAACSDPGVSREQYRQGWEQARSEGCDCDPFLTASDARERAALNRAWADGYTNGCLAVVRERACGLERRPEAETR